MPPRAAPLTSTLALPALMSLFAQSSSNLKAPCSAMPVLIGSPGGTSGGRRFTRVAGRFAFSASRCGLVGAQPSAATPFRLAFARAATRPVSVQTQPLFFVPVSPFAHQETTEKTAPFSSTRANPALNLAPFSRWTLRDKAAQRRLALRWASLSGFAQND